MPSDKKAANELREASGGDDVTRGEANLFKQLVGTQHDKLDIGLSSAVKDFSRVNWCAIDLVPDYIKDRRSAEAGRVNDLQQWVRLNCGVLGEVQKNGELEALEKLLVEHSSITDTVQAFERLREMLAAARLREVRFETEPLLRRRNLSKMDAPQLRVLVVSLQNELSASQRALSGCNLVNHPVVREILKEEEADAFTEAPIQTHVVDLDRLGLLRTDVGMESSAPYTLGAEPDPSPRRPVGEDLRGISSDLTEARRLLDELRDALRKAQQAHTEEGGPGAAQSEELMWDHQSSERCHPASWNAQVNNQALLARVEKGLHSVAAAVSGLRGSFAHHVSSLERALANRDDTIEMMQDIEGKLVDGKRQATMLNTQLASVFLRTVQHVYPSLWNKLASARDPDGNPTFVDLEELGRWEADNDAWLKSYIGALAHDLVSEDDMDNPQLAYLQQLGMGSSPRGAPPLGERQQSASALTPSNLRVKRRSRQNSKSQYVAQSEAVALQGLRSALEEEQRQAAAEKAKLLREMSKALGGLPILSKTNGGGGDNPNDRRKSSTVHGHRKSSLQSANSGSDGNPATKARSKGASVAGVGATVLDDVMRTLSGVGPTTSAVDLMDCIVSFAFDTGIIPSLLNQQQAGKCFGVVQARVEARAKLRAVLDPSSVLGAPASALHAELPQEQQQQQELMSPLRREKRREEQREVVALWLVQCAKLAFAKADNRPAVRLQLLVKHIRGHMENAARAKAKQSAEHNDQASALLAQVEKLRGQQRLELRRQQSSLRQSRVSAQTSNNSNSNSNNNNSGSSTRNKKKPRPPSEGRATRVSAGSPRSLPARTRIRRTGLAASMSVSAKEVSRNDALLYGLLLHFAMKADSMQGNHSSFGEIAKHTESIPRGGILLLLSEFELMPELQERNRAQEMLNHFPPRLGYEAFVAFLQQLAHESRAKLLRAPFLTFYTSTQPSEEAVCRQEDLPDPYSVLLSMLSHLCDSAIGPSLLVRGRQMFAMRQRMMQVHEKTGETGGRNSLSVPKVEEDRKKRKPSVGKVAPVQPGRKGTRLWGTFSAVVQLQEQLQEVEEKRAQS